MRYLTGASLIHNCECLVVEAGDVDAVGQLPGEHAATRDTGAGDDGSAGVINGEHGGLYRLIGDVPATDSHISAVFFFFIYPRSRGQEAAGSKGAGTLAVVDGLHAPLILHLGISNGNDMAGGGELSRVVANAQHAAVKDCRHGHESVVAAACGSQPDVVVNGLGRCDIVFRRLPR